MVWRRTGRFSHTKCRIPSGSRPLRNEHHACAELYGTLLAHLLVLNPANYSLGPSYGLSVRFVNDNIKFSNVADTKDIGEIPGSHMCYRPMVW